MFERTNTNGWYYSPDHGQLCKVIETQTLWGDTTCRVNLAKDDPALKAKGNERWYVHDPNKAGDLEKLRDQALMRQFEKYRESKQKRLKVFRLEAVRAGFKKSWQERDYATNIAVARKILEKILQEDPKLLLWYDQELTRSGEELHV